MYRYYRWKISKDRDRIDSVILRYSQDFLHLVKLLVALKSRRTIRRCSRVPVCEAIYNSWYDTHPDSGGFCVHDFLGRAYVAAHDRCGV